MRRLGRSCLGNDVPAIWCRIGILNLLRPGATFTLYQLLGCKVVTGKFTET
jgi:hypothetical protein